GTFMNKGAIVSGAGNGFNSGSGMTRFFDISTADNATFTNDAATVSGSGGGLTEFHNASTAGNGIFINKGATVNGAGGGFTYFYDKSTAGNATLVANGGTGGGLGGTIFFQDESTGGTSRVEVFGNGNLDISFHNAPSQKFPGAAIGSIEGDGNVFLGANNLTVGSNNMSTMFSGVIQDVGGQNSNTGGSLTKIGAATLDLTGANTYTGNTNVNGGVLKINGSITSNTFVNHGGTLAGIGTINGTLSSNHGTVSPGDATGTLTVNNYAQPIIGNGKLLIDIAGASDSQFSILNVLGNANVNSPERRNKTSGDHSSPLAPASAGNCSRSPLDHKVADIIPGSCAAPSGNAFASSAPSHTLPSPPALQDCGAAAAILPSVPLFPNALAALATCSQFGP